MDVKDIANRFAHHPPTTPIIAKAHELIRIEFYELAMKLNEICPDSREKSLILTSLEEAMFWANASVARSQITGLKE